MLQLAVPSAAGEFLLWSHLCLLWAILQYGHRFDPLGRAEAQNQGEAAVRRWTYRVLARAVIGALLVTALAGFGAIGIGLGGLFLVGGALVPLARRRFMVAQTAAKGRDLRAEVELAATLLILAVAAVLIGGAEAELARAFFVLPMPPMTIAGALLVAAGAVFLVRGGTHVVRGVLEKSDTLPEELASLGADQLRHGVTIGNIERLLIYLFALAGSHAAIGLVIAAKGVVRAVEWDDRAWVEYFLIGTLASAGLASVTGIGLRWLLVGF